MANSSETMDINSETEIELLKSDDEVTTKINLRGVKSTEAVGRKPRNNKSENNAKKSSLSTKTNETKATKTSKTKQIKPIASSSNHDEKHDQLLSMLSEIKCQNQDTNNELSTMKKVIAGKFNAIEDELKKNKRVVGAITGRLDEMENKVNAAAYDNELERQQKLKNNVSICGVPKADDENASAVALTVFKAFGLNFSPTDFTGVYRTTGRFSAIIVIFSEFTNKLSAMAAKSKKNVLLGDVADCDDSQRNTQIFINNHITPFFARLLGVGREGVRNKTIHSCWIATNGCLVKKTPEGKPIIVRSMDDMTKLTGGADSSSKKRSKPDFTSPNQSNGKRSK